MNPTILKNVINNYKNFDVFQDFFSLSSLFIEFYI